MPIASDVMAQPVARKIHKSQTDLIEAHNAELHYYLVRLARKFCCFSRSLRSLSYAVRLARLLLELSPALSAPLSLLSRSSGSLR